MNIMEMLGFGKQGAANNQNANQNANQNTKQSEPKTGKLGLIDSTPREEGKSRIYNLIILDESGSMQSIYNQALTGVNETINSIRQTQKEDPTTQQILTLVTFDSNSRRGDVRAIINCKAIDDVKNITHEDYKPWGGTPLYDAIGFSVEELSALTQEGDNVLVTVITDGYENSSNHYTGEMVKELLEALKAKGWVFTYIGANQNSEAVSRQMGFQGSMDFCQDEVGSTMMFDKMRRSNREYYRKVKMMKDTGRSVSLDEDFFMEKSSASRVTPDHIATLAPDEIFVFGSNLQGMHMGGAAAFAVEHFGAVMGQGAGLQGQSYAIPTMQGGVETIKPYVDEFLKFAETHPELKFFVTAIGCGIAGFSARQIAPLFADAIGLTNVYLPTEFWKVINYKFSSI